MGKKKQFTSKDSSTKFVLMHRSQQDADYGQEGASDLVLYPVGKPGAAAPPAKPQKHAAGLSKGKDHVNHLGLPNDGYDYERHMRSIGGEGVFVGKSGKVAQPSAVVLPPEAMASTKEEHGRLLEAITISDQCMDSDVAAALFDANYDNGELDDDFVIQASAAEAEEGGEGEGEGAFGGGGSGGFDYDAHIANLLKASEKGMGLTESPGSDDGSEYSDEGEGGDSGSEVGASSVIGSVLGVDGVQRAKIDLEFEKALLEYDSDECGPLEDPEDDPTLQGEVALDSEDISALMDEFLTVSAKDRVLLPKHDETSAAAAEAEAGSATAHEEPTEEGVAGQAGELADEKDDESSSDSGIEDYMPDYFKVKEVSQWDCETIVSTYSNLDNHPVRITEPPRESRKKKAPATASPSPSEPAVPDAPKRIVLSAKSGMPIGVLPAKQLQEDSDLGAESVRGNKGIGRSKEETKEEKRARKARIKEERQVTRATKTQTKAAFKQGALESQALSARSENGVAVFKY